MAYVDSRDAAPRFPLPALAVAGLAAIVLLAAGVAQLRTAQRVDSGAPEEPTSYRHTYRLFGALGVVFLIALAARGLAVPSDFGVDGHYRAAAPGDAARERPPRYRGRAACVECHAEKHALIAKDVHRSVECETCHGPGWQHIDEPKTAKLKVDKTGETCLLCHRALKARPTAFAQISVPEHQRAGGAKDGTACITCHDPHEPIFLQKAVSESRLHPLVQRCRDCHDEPPDVKLQKPADHLATFECSYCHKEVAADFAGRTHAKLNCVDCHIFVRENDFAGRIVRNTDPRFCLLCHRAGDARRDDGPPSIDWDEHRNTFDDTLPASAPCTTCHADSIHGELQGATP
jgi:hypothetical protein